jgi:hypothetical protein
MFSLRLFLSLHVESLSLSFLSISQLSFSQFSSQFYLFSLSFQSLFAQFHIYLLSFFSHYLEVLFSPSFFFVESFSLQSVSFLISSATQLLSLGSGIVLRRRDRRFTIVEGMCDAYEMTIPLTFLSLLMCSVILVNFSSYVGGTAIALSPHDLRTQ